MKRILFLLVILAHTSVFAQTNSFRKTIADNHCSCIEKAKADTTFTLEQLKYIEKDCEFMSIYPLILEIKKTCGLDYVDSVNTFFREARRTVREECNSLEQLRSLRRRIRDAERAKGVLADTVAIAPVVDSSVAVAIDS